MPDLQCLGLGGSLDQRQKAQLANLLYEDIKASPPERTPVASIGGADAMSLLEWTIKNRALLVPGRPFDLGRHPFLIDLYRDNHDSIVVFKSGQMGASEYLISDAIHAADERKATPLYIFPTSTHVSDFSTGRIGPAIEASQYLQSIVEDVRTTDGKRRRGSDRVTLKRIGDRFLYLRGAQVHLDGRAPQLKSVDADVLFLDEVDEMPPRAIALARERLGHSSLAQERAVSTPTYAGMGIHALWMESDQRVWMVRCDSCNHWQELTINHCVIESDALERPVFWHGQPDDAWCVCEKCSTRLNPRGPGRWVARHPGREVHGYHLTRLFSHHYPTLKLIQGLQAVEEEKRKEVINQGLGLPYHPRGGRLSDEHLNACCRDYAHGPVPSETTVMGIDVGSVLHFVVRGPAQPESGERPQRFAGMVDSFEAAANEIRRWDARRVVIDALPETRKARELQANFPPGVVWLAYYTDGVGRRADEMLWNEAEGTVTMDRTRTLDAVMAGFLEEKITLPRHARSIPDYYSQMKAVVRVIEKRPNGERVARYVEASEDHFAHSENYCEAARSAPRPPAATQTQVSVSRQQMEDRFR